jgi:phage-related protein
VYAVPYAGAVYVLYVQKKSKTGRKTPRREMEIIKQRLGEAERIASGETP